MINFGHNIYRRLVCGQIIHINLFTEHKTIGITNWTKYISIPFSSIPCWTNTLSLYLIAIVLKWCRKKKKIYSTISVADNPMKWNENLIIAWPNSYACSGHVQKDNISNVSNWYGFDTLSKVFHLKSIAFVISLLEYV